MEEQTNTSKMKYHLEGVVSEITKTANVNSFQIVGSEGYGLCQRKSNGEEKCNVLCEQGKIVSENRKPIHALKIPTDFSYNISDKFLQILTSAMISGKRVHIIFEESNNGNIEIGDTKFIVSSVTILAD